MKIIIAGAGAIGFHLAELMSKENQDITLIDSDEEVLTHAGSHLDVLTIKGDAASFAILEQAQVSKAQLFIAATTSEKTNILLTILAKQMGAKKTIARISNAEYLEPERKENFKKLGIDVLISPLQLASQEILRLLHRASFTDLFEFENGKISVVGFTLDTTCPLINKSITDIDGQTDDFIFRGIALLREGKTIIPRGNTILRKGDHLYIATRNEYMNKAMAFVGKQLKPIKNVMIVGGSPLAIKAAKLIEDKYQVTIVMNDKKQAKESAELLNKSLVIRADPGNIDILKEEGLGNMDAFIALTPNSETNIITSLMAEELGVYKTIALVDNVNYTHISQNIGIDTIINKKLIAANNIFRFVRKGKIEAIASLHGVDAEMIEFEIHKKNRLLKHPIRNLRFPKQSIIAGVIRGEKSYIPNGDFCFEINDKVIVLALPEAIRQVEELFK
ncbi:MAG: trk system potassium uptake protein TrkA [Polaribacter sp.]|jgi:trk system potassium uptake protein TrkA